MSYAMPYADAVAHISDACVGYACTSCARVPTPYACALHAAASYVYSSCVTASYTYGACASASRAYASHLPSPYTCTSCAPAARRLLLLPRQRLRSVTSSVLRVSLTLRST